MKFQKIVFCEPSEVGAGFRLYASWRSQTNCQNHFRPLAASELFAQELPLLSFWLVDRQVQEHLHPNQKAVETLETRDFLM